MRLLVFVLVAAMALSGEVLAGQAQVVDVKVNPEGRDTYGFSVTLRHADAGWDHYADRWDVLAPDGTVLGERVLFHPHVDEQPFTRSQSGILIPRGLTQVLIRAHDKVHGNNPELFRVALPDR